VTTTGRITLITIIAAVLALLLKQRSNSVALKPKHPTHKIVCQCECVPNPSSDAQAEDQTFDVPGGGCGSLEGAGCLDGEGSLHGCRKVSVPVRKSSLSVVVDFPQEAVQG